MPRLDFPSSHFLGFFLTVFAVYWLLPRHHWRMLWLLAVSCVFYMSWHPWLISLIFLSASVDYLVALRLHAIDSKPVRRLLLALSISVNLGLLAFFKYTNFLLDSANSLFALFGVDYRSPFFDKLVLPLGISFYTFETISYVVDVYKGRIQPVRRLLDYALFIMFFPHLAAGPIVRPRDFLPQLQRRKRLDWYRVMVGLLVFLVGLFKKAVLADHMAPVVEKVFTEPQLYSSSTVWLATLAYAVQIYCDFSGYSDMALGLAHMLGFKLPRNFYMPYFAASITDFWRRWHISLSSWLRDYLYIPLGGNRHGRWATYRNLLLTMLLGGLWHGASWTFVFWGFYHGLLLAGHRFWSETRRAACRVGELPGGRGSCRAASSQPLHGSAGASPSRRQPTVAVLLKVAVTFLCVCIGWVFFRAQTFAAAGTILARLAWPVSGLGLDPLPSILVIACLLLVFAGHLVGTFGNVRVVWQRWPAPALGSILAALLTLVLFLMPEIGQKFIYFQF